MEDLSMLIFSDIDGTLFSQPQNKIPDSADAAIQLARKNGHKVFICTGRGLAATSQYLNYDVDGFLFALGSLLYIEGKRSFSEPMDEKTVELLLDKMSELDYGYVLEGAAGVYCNDFGYESNAKYFHAKGEKRTAILRENGFYRLEQWDKRDRIYTMNIFGRYYGHVEKMEEFITDDLMILPGYYDLFPFGTAEIASKKNTKATGIQKVVEHYGTTVEETVAIGDNTNDIDMVQYAHVGIAMGNAVDQLKEVADYVTTDIDEDGMWNALKYVGAIEGNYEDYK